MKLTYHALCDICPKSASISLDGLFIVQDKETGLFFERFNWTVRFDNYSFYPRTAVDVKWSKQPNAVVVRMSDEDIWLRDHAESVEGV